MLFPIFHIVHVLAVIAWIGGLAFITVLILPMIVKMPEPLQKVLFFQRIEHRFAPLARVYNAVVGVTGFSMVALSGQPVEVYKNPFFIFMTAVWVLWFMMLFGLEPIIIRRMLDRLSKSGEKMEIETVFGRMNRLHTALLIVSLLASAAGVVFAHAYTG
jgi:uncharacterized membrane protein